MVPPFSTDLIGWLRILVAVAPGIAATFGMAWAFTLAMWAGVEIMGRRKRI